jgi:hypothetical protein
MFVMGLFSEYGSIIPDPRLVSPSSTGSPSVLI